MKPSRFILYGICVFALAAVVGRSSELRTAQAVPNPRIDSRGSAPQETGKPVVLELFTSEGCSSCPPADALLSNLARTQPVPGAHVIVLAEHVDYWNNLGWDDRFSSSAYSARQSDYARQFRLESVYTPQLVVDGHAQFVGSDQDAATQAITSAASKPKADVRVSAQTSGDTLTVTTSIQKLPNGTQGSDVMLAITESGLSTHVKDGENSGRTLNHNGVVRILKSIGTADSTAFSKTTAIELKSGWKREQLQAVVFVQDRATHNIVGAAETGV